MVWNIEKEYLYIHGTLTNITTPGQKRLASNINEGVTPYSLKLHNRSLTIGWFCVISRTLFFVRGSPLSRDAVDISYNPSWLGKRERHKVISRPWLNKRFFFKSLLKKHINLVCKHKVLTLDNFTNFLIDGQLIKNFIKMPELLMHLKKFYFRSNFWKIIPTILLWLCLR